MNLEQEVERIAEQYRCEGYRVIRRPAAADLPPFAQGYDVDLVAFRDGESVLVQVKASRKELQEDQQLLRLAEAVDHQPGWRLDLVVLGAGSPLRVAAQASEPPVEKILESLADAEQMTRAGALSASCVISWAGLEAAMRHAARNAGLELANHSPPVLLRALYSDGLLDRDEFDRLNAALEIRNAVAHGLALPSIDPAVPEYVTGVARKLLTPNGKNHHS
jgi:hypothetical protein